ncbi:MAG: hypothetical protein ACK5LX_15340 [Oscillospiraceae bacterium]
MRKGKLANIRVRLCIYLGILLLFGVIGFVGTLLESGAAGNAALFALQSLLPFAALFIILEVVLFISGKVTEDEETGEETAADENDKDK